MTTREQIIAAAKKAGFFISNKQIFTAVLEHLPLTKNLERFYAIALEHGRRLEREECILDLHRNADQTLEEIIAAIRARGDSK